MFIEILAYVVVGFAVGTMAHDYFVTRPLRRVFKQQLKQAMEGWADTIQLANELKAYLEENHEGGGYKKDEHGNIISPLQTGREGS